MGNEFKFSSEAFSFRRRSWLFVVSIILFCCSLRCRADPGQLESLWNIQDPEAKICRARGELDNLPPNSTITSKICDNRSSVIQMEYTIHQNAKFPKYKIFQKDCQAEFEDGTEQVKSSVSPDEDGRFDLAKTAGSSGGDSVTASLEILLAEGSLKTSWWQLLTFSEREPQTIEFCIHMGLWLPPQAGKMEVNFRDTNVAVTFDKDGSITNITLDTLELKSVKIDLAGGSLKKPDPRAVNGADDKDEL